MESVLNLIRWAVAAIVLGALAPSLAHAATHAGKNGLRHGRHHHHSAGPVSVSRPGSSTPAAARDGAGADRAKGDGRNPGSPGADAPVHKGVRAIPTLRDRPDFVARANKAPAAGSGHAGAGHAAQHGVNLDLIFVPKPGRNARSLGKSSVPKKAAAARPAEPTGFRRQRLDAGGMGAAKNAIGVAMRANASINPTGAGRASLGPTPVGEAGKTNALGAHMGQQGAGAAGPGSGSKAVTGVGPASAGRPGGGPAPVAVPSAYGGGISGTGVHRPGSAPPAIGGPARLLAGIGGTGLKSKR
jgi:translation initiation factor IF-2